MNKPIEYWAGLIGMVLYVATRDAEREPLIKRLAKVVASAFLARNQYPHGADRPAQCRCDGCSVRHHATQRTVGPMSRARDYRGDMTLYNALLVGSQAMFSGAP